jgi:ribosomal protein S17E
MKKIHPHFERPHARYSYEENGFICLICEKEGFKKWVWEPWEIPKHLKIHHKIKRRKQVISGWNEEFEKEYSQNRKKPLKYVDENDIFIYDVEFEGKKYRKEQFVYYPYSEPKKRMKYGSAFYNLWLREKGIKTSHELWEKFINHFNELFGERKKKMKAITWDDFKNLNLQK